MELLNVDKEWANKRKNDLLEQQDIHQKTKEGKFVKNVQTELENDFFCLRRTQKYQDSSCFYQFASCDDRHDRGLIDEINTVTNLHSL